eukprot:CAMPEP_0184298460 /NCGR_PEP_ID=MMETSP1049-20130417/9265_1 /TAXON_ID=77928 /ORGANISM="Proteomonas sulcata, Strain CCMP704" /LENGTH=585 /DNA_ID=CAMNT_0026608599 /DNA_START=108 /DNA_END=1865 /DNA_ORIENTATION=+
MFSSNVVGLACATAAGWGNLGGGIALAVMGPLFSAFKDAGLTNNEAWRYSLTWPPVVCTLTGLFTYFCTDDCPFGNFKQLREHKDGSMQQEYQLVVNHEKLGRRVIESMKAAAANYCTWILFLVYAFSFGVEIVVYSNIPMYFSDQFGLSQADAGMAGSLMGLFNLFARSVGGFLSDRASHHKGARGRMWVLFVCTVAMSASLIAFCSVTSESGGFTAALLALSVWAMFLMMTEGAVFALVPFIAEHRGGVTGLVGAGGIGGALIGNFLMSFGMRSGFFVLAICGFASALLIPFIWISGEGSMLKLHFQATELSVVEVVEEVEEVEECRVRQPNLENRGSPFRPVETTQARWQPTLRPLSEDQSLTGGSRDVTPRGSRVATPQSDSVFLAIDHTATGSDVVRGVGVCDDWKAVRDSPAPSCDPFHPGSPTDCPCVPARRPANSKTPSCLSGLAFHGLKPAPVIELQRSGVGMSAMGTFDARVLKGGSLEADGAPSAPSNIAGVGTLSRSGEVLTRVGTGMPGAPGPSELGAMEQLILYTGGEPVVAEGEVLDDRLGSVLNPSFWRIGAQVVMQGRRLSQSDSPDV